MPLSRGDGPGSATLRRLYVVEQWSTADLKARYRVGSPTVRRWLLAAGIAIRPRGSGGFRRQLVAPPRQELAELGQNLWAPEIAKRLGVSAATVRRWFAEAELTPPSGSLRNRPRGALTPVQRPTADRLQQLYVQEGLSIPGVKLYVESEWSAEDVAARLDSAVHVVLRTGHAHGVPIRQGGGGGPAVTVAVALIDSLYRDEQISEVLDRHAVPRRPAGGDIAVRFPDPVPMTAQLLDELYHGAGCSSSQIELLTGHPPHPAARAGACRERRGEGDPQGRARRPVGEVELADLPGGTLRDEPHHAPARVL